MGRIIESYCYIKKQIVEFEHQDGCSFGLPCGPDDTNECCECDYEQVGDANV